MKALKFIARIALIPALIMMFSKAEDSVVWIQFLAAGYVITYVCVKFRGVKYEQN